MAVVYKIKRFSAPPQRPPKQRTRPPASPAELQLRRAKEIRLQEQLKIKREAVQKKSQDRLRSDMIKRDQVETRKQENTLKSAKNGKGSINNGNGGKAPSLVSRNTIPTGTVSVNN
jgi:hypothetical protein